MGSVRIPGRRLSGVGLVLCSSGFVVFGTALDLRVASSPPSATQPVSVQRALPCLNSAAVEPHDRPSCTTHLDRRPQPDHNLPTGASDALLALPPPVGVIPRAQRYSADSDRAIATQQHSTEDPQ